jgi:hypothetical protein
MLKAIKSTKCKNNILLVVIKKVDGAIKAGG